MIVACVDDDRATNFLNAHLVKSACESAQIYSFTNGKEILDFEGIGDLDYIFLDLNMPVMGGLEFLEKSRGRCNAKVIVALAEISENNFDSIKLEYDNVVGYFHKPLTKEVLLNLCSNEIK